MAIAKLNFSLITKRKRMIDSVGHYSRPELLQLQGNLDAQTVMNTSYLPVNFEQYPLAEPASQNK